VLHKEIAQLYYTGKDGLICEHLRVGVKIRMNGGLSSVGENPAHAERENEIMRSICRIS
jgi:hypothetical protein